LSSFDPWKVTPAEGIEIQKRLRGLVRRTWDGRRIRLIAGADVHFPTKKTVRAVIAVVTYPALELVELSSFEGACNFPYVPGLLSFREIPPLLEAWKKLESKPDLILCDGQGIAHPRGLGFASHFGLVLGVPTIGCAKSPLFGEFKMPGVRRGSRSPIKDPSGKTIGAVLRTRDRTKPLYVSVGHLISLRKAVALVLSCAPRFRRPEPLRIAHHVAGRGAAHSPK
jgi:deoxyribonuclease V